MKQLEIFGDSIMRGVINDNGHLKLRKESLADKIKCEQYSVRNNAQIGATIIKGTKKLSMRMGDLGPDSIAILGFGGNDCDYDWISISSNPEEQHFPKVTLSDFIHKYTEMIRIIKATGAMVVVCNLIPLDAQKYFQWISRLGSADIILSWLGDTSMLYRWHEVYNRAVETLASTEKCILVNLRESFLLRHDFKELLCCDGIHPTELGHNIIDECLIAQLKLQNNGELL